MAEMSEEKFDNLNQKVDDLIQLCREIKRENQALQASENGWQSERRKLLEKNKETKSKLESILIRLKAINYS